LETSAFLTGVNIVEKGPKKIDENLPKAAEINQTHAKLNELVTVSHIVLFPKTLNSSVHSKSLTFIQMSTFKLFEEIINF
jgi:hypothetical protein